MAGFAGHFLRAEIFLGREPLAGEALQPLRLAEAPDQPCHDLRRLALPVGQEGVQHAQGRIQIGGGHAVEQAEGIFLPRLGKGGLDLVGAEPRPRRIAGGQRQAGGLQRRSLVLHQLENGVDRLLVGGEPVGRQLLPDPRRLLRIAQLPEHFLVGRADRGLEGFGQAVAFGHEEEDGVVGRVLKVGFERAHSRLRRHSLGAPVFDHPPRRKERGVLQEPDQLLGRDILGVKPRVFGRRSILFGYRADEFLYEDLALSDFGAGEEVGGGGGSGRHRSLNTFG